MANLGLGISIELEHDKLPTKSVAQPVQPVQPLHVYITREPFSDFFVFTLDNGHTEELEAEEARQWLRDRGGNMDLMEKALDQVFNFQRCDVFIDKPREPYQLRLPHSPNI
jgi:hypothetical protein